MNTRTFLVATDIVVFLIAAAYQRVVRWEWGIWSQWADEVEAEKAMEDYLESLIIDLGADEMIICLTDDENFRKSILPMCATNNFTKVDTISCNGKPYYVLISGNPQ